MQAPSNPSQRAQHRARSVTPDAYAAMGWIEEFSALARMAIDEDDDEALRRGYEDELLRRAAYLRAAGLFDVLEIRHPALRAMLDDAR